jgi:hypothetical protein
MSWGYFAELEVTLPTDALAKLRKKKPSDVALAKGWSGLIDENLEAAFGRRLTTRETFEKTLGWYQTGGSLPSIRREETNGDQATLRVLTMLEKSLLDHAFPLAAMFHAVRDAGGAGTFRLVNDGTAPGEAGAELTLVDGTITKRRLDLDWDLTGRFGAELFAPSSAEPSPQEAKATTRTTKTPKKEVAKQPPAKTSKKAPGADAELFARFVERDGLAWLSANRSLDEVTSLLDGAATEDTLGVLRYLHYRRSASTLAPADAAEPAFRVSLTGRSGALIMVVLVVGGAPNEGVHPSEDAIESIGETWRKAVNALGKRLDLKRTENAKRGAANQRLAFRGSVDGVALELAWSRTVRVEGGRIVGVVYLVLLQRT